MAAAQLSPMLMHLLIWLPRRLSAWRLIWRLLLRRRPYPLFPPQLLGGPVGLIRRRNLSFLHPPVVWTTGRLLSFLLLL